MRLFEIFSSILSTLQIVKKKTLKDVIQHDNFTSERSLQVYDCEFYSFHKDKSHRVRVKNCSEQKNKLTSISSLIETLPRRNNDTNVGKKKYSFWRKMLKVARVV